MRSKNLNHILAGAAAVGITGGLAAFSFNRSHRSDAGQSSDGASGEVQRAALSPHYASPSALRPIEEELRRVMRIVRFSGQGAVWRSPGNVVSVECGADEEGSPIEHKTVFDIASVSKQFTAVGILRLVDAGKLSLDSKISDC